MERPMILIYLTFTMGVCTFFVFQYFGIVPVFLFIILALIFLWKLEEKNFTYILVGFLLLGILSCVLFYNCVNNEKVYRIISEENEYYIGKSNFKKYIIYSKEPLIEGERYFIDGSFEKAPQYNKGIVGAITLSKKIKLESDLLSKYQDLKKIFYEKLTSVGLSEDESAVLLALSLGDSSYISYESRANLNVLGIAHVISVSGLHLSLIYGMLKKIIGYKLALIFSALFVIFTGMQASTCRAFIMIFLLVMSTRVKRKYDCASAIAIAAFILLLIEPYYIMNMGYVLTFTAVAGILVFNEFFQRRLYRLPSFISSSLSLSLSSMIFTIPYLIFTYKKISVGGLVSNILLIPFYTIQMILGILGFFFLKFQGVFKLIFLVAGIIFKIIETIEQVLLNILPGLIKFTYFQGFIILILYLAFCIIKKGKKELLLFPIVAFMCVFVESYVVFPQVNYIAAKNNSIVQVKYKGKNILISGNKVKLKYVYEELNEVDRIYDEFDKDILINLDSSYAIYVLKESGDIVATLLYKDKGNKILMKEDSEEFEGAELQCYNNNLTPFYMEKCDIMVFENDKNDDRSGHYFYKLIVVGPWIFEKYIY